MYNRLKHSNWWRYVVTLIIGGLLVVLGYLIGDSAPSVEAQDSVATFDTLTCKRFVVSDGNPEHGSIELGIYEKGPTLVLSDNSDWGKSRIQIQISIEDDPKSNVEAAILSLINGYNDGSDIGLIAGRGETAIVNLRAKRRIPPGISLGVGNKGSRIMLEGDLIQSRMR